MENQTRRLLLHTCCGPCTIYPLRRLRDAGWTVHGYFYNPNIHPYQEFRKRMETIRSFAESENFPLIVREDYDLVEFLRSVVFREEERCLVCYSVRIEATARLAKKSGFDAFSTTLLFSRLQKHDLIARIARDAAQKSSISFYYEDFREGWTEGREQSKNLGMYRQQYCGCIYSEADRFSGKTGKAREAQNR